MRLLHKLSLEVEVGRVVKKVRTVCKERMMSVLFREYDVLRCHPPVDGQCGVVPCNGGLRLGCIIIVAFVLEYGMVRKDAETMGETTRDEKLPMAVGGQFDRDVEPESRAASTDIHRHVQDGTLDDTDELALAESPFLEMQAAYDAV